MNNFVVSAVLIKDPDLRFTADNQLPIAEFAIEFPGSKDGDPVSRIKVTAFGNLANQVAELYKSGDRVVVEGRVSMNVVELEGYKEKRAEMVATRVHQLSQSGEAPAKASTKTYVKAEQTKNPAEVNPYLPSSTKGLIYREAEEAEKAKEAGQVKQPASKKQAPAQDLDEIPF